MVTVHPSKGVWPLHLDRATILKYTGLSLSRSLTLGESLPCFLIDATEERSVGISGSRLADDTQYTSIWCLWSGFAPYSTVVQNYRVIVSTSAAAPSSSSTFHPTVYTLLLYVTNIPYWNTLEFTLTEGEYLTVCPQPIRTNVLQYGSTVNFIRLVTQDLFWVGWHTVETCIIWYPRRDTSPQPTVS